MDDRLYQYLKYTAIVLTLMWVGWSVYDGVLRTDHPGDAEYFAAEKSFEDGHYDRALEFYVASLKVAPDHIHALRGKARSLLQLERFPEALEVFNLIIAKDPVLGVSYANRGILYDRMGEHEKALADYEQALRLDPALAEGPGWLTRFFRLQPEKPSTIYERAAYLRAELKKPPKDRRLRMPQLDDKQQPYKQ